MLGFLSLFLIFGGGGIYTIMDAPISMVTHRQPNKSPIKVPVHFLLENLVEGKKEEEKKKKHAHLV